MPHEIYSQQGGGTPPRHPESQMAAHAPDTIVPDRRGLRARTEPSRRAEKAPSAGLPIVAPLSLRARTR